ncbi:unnamed protein product [Ectocarpus sp. 6 AP-2014]
MRCGETTAGAALQRHRQVGLEEVPATAAATASRSMDKKPHGAAGGDDQEAPFEDPEDAVGFGARRLLQRLPTKTYCTAATGAWIKTKTCTLAAVKVFDANWKGRYPTRHTFRVPCTCTCCSLCWGRTGSRAS